MKKDPLALRGRVLLVFQATWRRPGGEFFLEPGRVRVVDIARELGVIRQAVYRACPELKGRR